ncbi:hypothetical protein UG55_10187 [Frankia sp. EI5c]|nr:hypothetical protein UG55_10187 [Frankia sp. EI5c]
MGRPFHVYDYEGEHLGSFPSWDRAHEWAHLQAALHGVPTPLEVEDRANAGRRRVWADRCEPVGADARWGVGISAAWPSGSGGSEGSGGSGEPFDTDLLGAGRCAVALAPAFAPPRPRQPSDPTGNGAGGGGEPSGIMSGGIAASGIAASGNGSSGGSTEA